MVTRFPQTFSITKVRSESDVEFIFSNPHCTKNDASRLKRIFELISYPFVIFSESDYIDKVYRDSYYTFFSNKHIDLERNCTRISMFNDTSLTLNIEDFSQENEEILKAHFVGSIVLRPLSGCFIGRTLLDPSKLHIAASYIRTTPFNHILYGHEFSIEAFPFSSQDSETMTCAETSVWSILEYYGTRYPEYRTILPSNIIKKLEDMSYERNLPSRGLTYQAVTALLKTFGFSPRLYAREVYMKEKDDREAKSFRRIFHYYIESGIPIALGIVRKNTDSGIEEKHSIVAIGHTKRKMTPEAERLGDLPFVNTADLYNEYIIMDDNSIPYTVEQYDQFSLFNNGKATCFSVPLYKRIFMEAKDAEDIIYELLENPSLQKKIKDTMPVNDSTPLMARIYLTSSRKYKKLRGRLSASLETAAFYQQLAYPKFLWVAELTTYEKYGDEEIYGEIVLDATADRNNPEDSIICMRFLSSFSYRMPDESVTVLGDFHKFADASANDTYKMYKNNLNEGGF